MPFLKKPRRKPSLIQQKQAERNGIKRTIYMPNGNSYTGEWKDDLKHGFGTQIWKISNIRYSGEWKKGVRSGYGTLSKFDDEDNTFHCIYGGTWDNDQRNGGGQNHYEDGGVYEGKWRNGKRHGDGRMDFADGSVYEGYWIEDKRSGYGVMTYATDDIYKGWWLHDEKSGEGILEMPNTGYHKGTWKNNLKHGHGIYYFKNTGVTIIGVWLKDIPRCGTMEIMQHKNDSPILSLGIPECTLVEPDAVLDEAIQQLFTNAERDNKNENSAK